MPAALSRRESRQRITPSSVRPTLRQLDDDRCEVVLLAVHDAPGFGVMGGTQTAGQGVLFKDVTSTGLPTCVNPDGQASEPSFNRSATNAQQPIWVRTRASAFCRGRQGVRQTPDPAPPVAMRLGRPRALGWRAARALEHRPCEGHDPVDARLCGCPPVHLHPDRFRRRRCALLSANDSSHGRRRLCQPVCDESARRTRIPDCGGSPVAVADQKPEYKVACERVPLVGRLRHGGSITGISSTRSTALLVDGRLGAASMSPTT